MSQLKTGVELIAAERQRQIEVEQLTASHDAVCNKNGELAQAAVAYAMAPPNEIGLSPSGKDRRKTYWPSKWDATWWKPSPSRIRELVKAGALIAAEIDRLNSITPQKITDGE